MKRILLFVASLISACAQTPSAPAPAAPLEDSSRQIYWQRSLEDALAMCKATGAPLLVAMNMDGESASERITKENYRDPKFVALTRSFVCVIGSVFRHNLRDHDEQGRRIPCPRLGEVTCGEHIALEPILFDKYLGGERIAPRHALILADGTKKFDEFLLYDLRELDKIFAVAQPTGDLAPRSPRDGSWFNNRNRERLAYEDALWQKKDLGPDLDRLSREGDKGAIEALERLAVIAAGSEPRFGMRVAQTAEALGLSKEYAGILRARGGALGLAPLARLDPGPATQTLLLADLVVGNDSERKAARAVLDSALAPEVVARIGSAESPLVWPLDVDFVRVLVESAMGTAPLSDERPPADISALERELEQADQALQKDTQDPQACARMGRASLALARSRIEAGFTKDVPLLLQDANHWLAKAAEQLPKDISLPLDRAETSYRLSDFAAEEAHALEALKLAPEGLRFPVRVNPKSGLAFPLAREIRETLRWVGDSAARNVALRSGGDPVLELSGIQRGANALALILQDLHAGENDWLAIASFHGLLGRHDLELEYLQLGVKRLPESQALRAALADACWRAGDLEPLTHAAEEAVTLHEDSAAAQWYLGVAWVQRAEWARRSERPGDAIREYQGAERAFERCAELKPEFAPNCQEQRARCRLGHGFAHLLGDERASAAQKLAEALELAPGLQGSRDGLDREPLDLLDQSLEWRASGPSAVDASKLLERLQAATPGNAYWPRALSDSELREARRAQHRNAPGEAIVYCEIAIVAARHAREISDDEDSKRALLLPLSLEAELFLAKDELAPGRPPLLEVARELGLAVATEPDLGACKQLLAEVREKLGEAAPVNRPGR